MADSDITRREKHARYMREWAARNKDKKAANDRRYRARHAERIKDQKRQDYERNRSSILGKRRARYAQCASEIQRVQTFRRYGITLAEMEVAFVNQDGRCPICQRELVLERHMSNSCHIDHDHNTGQVRGLLCGKCNRGIGLLSDNPNLLRAAADYLVRSHG